MTQGARAVDLGLKSEVQVKDVLINNGYNHIKNKDIDLLNEDTDLKDEKYFLSQKSLKFNKKFNKEIILELGINDEHYFDDIKDLTYKPDFISFEVKDRKIFNQTYIEVKSKTSQGSDHEKYSYVGCKFNLLIEAGYPFKNLVVVLSKMLDVNSGSYEENKNAYKSEVKSIAGKTEISKCLTSLHKSLQLVKENWRVVYLSEIISGKQVL